MDQSYIKLNRKIVDWEWYSDINTCRLFIHMLLKANWKDGNFKGKQIPRGSFASSFGKLAEETQLTVDEVRTAVKHLISTKEITKHGYSKFTVFTVKNYDAYQIVPSNLPNKSQAVPKQLPTIEEVKKERREEGNKKEKRNIKEKYFDSEKINAVFLDYIQMRKSIKAPMTDKAIDLAVNKLKKLSEIPFSDGTLDEDIAVEILNNSIMNNWKGLFPLKEQRRQDAGGENKSFEDIWRDA